jgi:hypothetical protein
VATPVTELHERLRRAELSEPQAAAVAGAFEALDRKIDGVEHRLGERIDALDRRLDGLQHQISRLAGRMTGGVWLLGLVLAAVLGPYVVALFRLATG